MPQQLLDLRLNAGKPDAGDDQDFSLAGPQARPQGAVYVDPDYRHYNPQYGHAQDSPVWSLAQPLAHVVRSWWGALGCNTGGCFNGARDFGPRLVVVMAGWGGHLFREKHAWWVWGLWIASIAGGLSGAFIYDLALFTGGESPVNYHPRKRKWALLLKEVKWRHRLGIWPQKRVDDVERQFRSWRRE